MRGRGGYIPRGGGSSRGSYYQGNSSNYVNTRPGQGNYRPNGGRYDNYNNNRYSGGTGGSSHYDNRSRDKFTHHSSSTGGRYETGHKRSYDSSRDRNDDRKRQRQDDYRRTSSSNDRSDRPSSSSQNIGSSSSNYHQRSSTGGGGSSSVNHSSSYRPRDDSSSRHRDTSMGPPKRPLLRSVAGSNYISRPRGTMSMRGGIIRTSIRGVGPMRIVRPRINELNDLRTMRRQLLYAQQKDRARLLKIQQLKSSLRRQRQGGNSSDNSSDDEDMDDDGEKKKNKSKLDDDNDDDGGDDKDADEDKKGETTKKSPIKKRSSKTDNNGDDENEGDEEQKDGNESDSKNAKASASDDEAKEKTDDNADGETNKVAEKNKEKGKSSPAEKTGKKKEKDADDSKDKLKKSPAKKERSRKDKDDKDSDDGRKEKRSSRHREEEHNNIRKRTFIKLTCVHCRIKCVTFKEYTYHLNSRTHKTSMRQVALRQRADLQRMRARQRTAQREIEENSKEEYESRYCRLCRLAYRQPKNLHQASDHHKTIKKFLMPYCGSCHLAFKNAMLYENHRCSLDHIRNKARNDESASEVSADEREIDLNKFLTVDSVGEIDDDVMDADVDAILIEAETAQKSTDEETRKRALIGVDFIKKVVTFHCELCNQYTPKSEDDTLEAFVKMHCLKHSHVKSYLRHKEESENKMKSEVGDADGNTKDISDNQNLDEIEMIGKMEIDEDEEEDFEDAEEEDEEHDEKLWEEVDKDLGDLLAEVEPLGNDDEEEEEEDESVLNIDIESEKNKPKDAKEESNGNAEDTSKETKVTPAKQQVKKAAVPTPPTKVLIKQEPVSVKKPVVKPAATPIKINRPGPASTKRNVLVSVKRTSAATIKAATKTSAGTTDAQ